MVGFQSLSLHISHVSSFYLSFSYKVSIFLSLLQQLLLLLLSVNCKAEKLAFFFIFVDRMAGSLPILFPSFTSQLLVSTIITPLCTNLFSFVLVNFSGVFCWLMLNHLNFSFRASQLAQASNLNDFELLQNSRWYQNIVKLHPYERTKNNKTPGNNDK